MDIERIERALRAGPADEPQYIPGTFRPGRSRSRLRSALLAGGIAASITIGVVIGVGLGALRQSTGQVGGTASGPAAALRGHWISQRITRETWIDLLLAKGHRQEDIDAFLAHDPFQSMVHYEIDITDDRILISAVFDDKPVAPMSGGPYQMVGPSTFRYDDVGCFVTAQFEVTGVWLSFDQPAFESCDADEQIANTAFFNPWPYTRGGPP